MIAAGTVQSLEAALEKLRRQVVRSVAASVSEWSIAMVAAEATRLSSGA